MISESAISPEWVRWVSKARTSIQNAMLHPGKYERSKLFITRERLEDVWSENGDGSCLLDEFQRYMPAFSRDEVRDHLLGVVSILVSIHLEDWSVFTNRFGVVAGKLQDADLPLSSEQCDEVFCNSRVVASDFRDTQFMFIPARIHQGNPQPLDDAEWRLPLVSEGEKNKTGSYGTVTKVAIAKGYFIDRNGQENNKDLIAARKLFSIRPNYDTELRVLSVLQSGGITNERVMGHLGSIIVGSQFSIFFPWADLNLDQFFDDSLRPASIGREMITSKNLLQECLWLSRALQFLHTQLLDAQGRSIQCCHMDLKPDNILVTNVGDPKYPLGMWKITDFGISNIEARSMSPSIRDFYNISTTTRPATRPAFMRPPRYPGPFQPPEAENGQRLTYSAGKNMNDLKGDIWSFGCIFLVILSFAVGGNIYIKELEVRRQANIDPDGIIRSGRFYCKSSMQLEIMPRVVDWFEHLAELSQCDWFADSWSFIKNHMLVIDPGPRVDAEIVADKLSRLVGIAEPTNRWNDAPDPKSVGLIPTPLHHSGVVEDGQKNTASLSTEADPAQFDVHEGTSPAEQVLGGSNHISTQTEQVRTPEADLSSSKPPADGSNIITATSHPSGSGQSRSSIAPSRVSSTSNSSENLVQVYDLSERLRKEKYVALASNGARVGFSNQNRAIVFSKRLDNAEFSTETFPPPFEIQATSKTSTWELIQVSGPMLVLRDEDSLSISSWNLSDSPPRAQIWDNKIKTKDVVGFELSPKGSIAFRMRRAIEVFLSLDSAQPKIRWGITEEHVKAVAFSKSGNRLIAVCDKTWALWDLNDILFNIPTTRSHNLSRPEHGRFEPSILPFNTSPSFLLWDRAYRDRISIIRGGDDQQATTTTWPMPADTQNVAISDDDRTFVVLIAKRQLSSFRRSRFSLQWTGIIFDPQRGHLAIAKEYQKHDIKASSSDLSTSLAVVSSSSTSDSQTTDVAMVAFANGHIEEIPLVVA